ncbi:sensor histidine kinase YesM [Pedobacter cryoconitis]|uniref:Sensor histidine kinase YesM n=1 Tax=Pedobacter cryoconitis TaxID=188932 RepID=A0A7W8ZPD2_9SPHI|nr:histidine kinase [Pedobacter cryoconitis]MBB5637573.1 sensor histidine kinase YesM [Pedobacter cryoconitis]MBB6270001.1 sensor histidine kinase YesM [Pedobacter cryoconitis]
MKRSKAKSALLTAFTFISSYITVFIIFPNSYWRDYFNLPLSGIITDILVNLLFCVLLVELSLFIDRRLNKKISWMVHPLKRLLTQTLFQVLGVLFLIICLGAIYLIFGNHANTQPPYLNIRQSLYTIVLIILWPLMVSALNTGDFLLTNWKTATLKSAEFEIKAAQNKQLASEIELQALKLQLDPHFVFNNLSVLSELILQDQQLGYEYTKNFTKVYRYLLVNSKKKLIPLHEELKFLDAYLFLIKNRMGDGCIFQIDISESRLNMLIPPVTLQLFIENALKYNRTVEEDPLIVRIYSNDDDELVVVNNLLPLIKKHDSTGLGLKNIIDRYALLGDKMPEIEKNAQTFTIKVPLIK